MKMKYLIPILLALFIGFIMGKYMFDQYDNKINIKPVFSKSEKVTIMQLGVYSTKENMIKNTKSFPYYIYTNKNNKYYVYIGMTKNTKNIEKLKGYYKSLGYIIYVKEFDVNNEAFNQLLTQYDSLLLETEDKKAIDAICSQVLSKYEEMVVNGSEN